MASAAIKQDITETAAKFERENGKRHRKLQEMRNAGKIGTKAFDRLYEAEDQWLQRNGIKFSPEHRAWVSTKH